MAQSSSIHKDWAEEKGVDLAHAIVLTGIDKDAHDTNTIGTELSQFGGVTVKEVKDSGEEGKELQALCVFKGKVSTLMIGDTIKITSGGEWRVTKFVTLPPEEDFDTQLTKFLALHKKTMSDIKGHGDIPEEVVKHVHIVQAATQPSYQPQRRMKMFSGKTPLPSGELSFDSWAQHISHIISEPSLSEDDKLGKLVGSLQPPALMIYYKAVGAAGPLTTAEALAHLGQVYGVACEPEELYMVFRETFQQHGESPSAYLMRLEEALDRAILFGGVKKVNANALRLAQFVRGCAHNESLVATLQLRGKKDDPPTFIDLIQEVRQEEAAEALRGKYRSPQKTNLKKTVSFAASAEVDRLNPIDDTGKGESGNPASSRRMKATKSEQEVLLAEVTRLKEELASMRTTGNNNAARPQRPSRPRARGFCYHCGLQGHYRQECQNASNPELVQRRLLERCKSRAGNGPGHL